MADLSRYCLMTVQKYIFGMFLQFSNMFNGTSRPVAKKKKWTKHNQKEKPKGEQLTSHKRISTVGRRGWDGDSVDQRLLEGLKYSADEGEESKVPTFSKTSSTTWISYTLNSSKEGRFGAGSMTGKVVGNAKMLRGINHVGGSVEFVASVGQLLVHAVELEFEWIFWSWILHPSPLHEVPIH